MLLTYKPEDYQKEAERISERAAKQFPWVKDFKQPVDELKYAKEQAREFFLEQGGKTDRNSHVRDVKVTIEANKYFRIETGIGGPYGAGGFKLVAVPQHERIAERKRPGMEDGQQPWMTVDVGNSLRLHHKNRGSDCNPTSTWSKADWLMEKGRQFDESKEKAAQKPAARMAPPPPAFMLRDHQKPAAASQR
jgi:hypothetical protein